jgi:hypothetical protein
VPELVDIDGAFAHSRLLERLAAEALSRSSYLATRCIVAAPAAQPLVTRAAAESVEITGPSDVDSDGPD